MKKLVFAKQSGIGPVQTSLGRPKAPIEGGMVQTHEHFFVEEHFFFIVSVFLYLLYVFTQR